MNKFKKYSFLLFPFTFSFANNANWQDFDNNLYVGGGFALNSSSVNQFGVASNNFGVAQIGTTALFGNGIYFNIEGVAKFTSGGSFIGNWYNGVLKFGYSIQPDDNLNFTPYLSLGYGDSGAFYSTASNLSYGVGLLSELMFNSNLSLYLDLGYQLQDYKTAINNDFSTNVLGGFAAYSLSGNPSIIDASLGLKYITQGGYYINPFFKFENYQQSFIQSSSGLSYGGLNSIVNQYQFGVNVGASI